MITSKHRIGKDLNQLSMMELIEEFKAMNFEGGNFAITALELNLSEEQRGMLQTKCKEFEDYQKEVACEFVKRFIK